MEEEEKKIQLPEAILMIIIVFLSDVGDIFGMLIFGIPIIGQIVILGTKAFSFLAWALIQLWLIMKGVRGLWFSAGSLVDLIGLPFAQTATIMVTIYLANHPKTAGAITKIAGVTGTAALVAAGARTTVATGERLAAREATLGAREVVADEAVSAETEVSEEAFGVPKEPLEKLKEVMEEFPESNSNQNTV
ncbi:MAG: hypothetical protein HYT13_00135 [Candidatus Liptonbacteria bacterium]|nr:hypothetical protein [Candidatus Liptonbacteria bacterium]